MGWLDAGFVSDLVSVVVPTYDRCALLGEAIESLAAQTWARMEVIVVDDGSTDGTTAQWLPKLAAMSSEQRVYRLITQVNSGVSAARNTGTLVARGEFIMYLDSDDRLYPEAITRYVETLRRHNAEYCIAPIDTVDESGRLIEDQCFHPRHQAEEYLFDSFWLAHAACYRREVVNRAGCWNSQLRQGEDHEYLWRVKLTSGRGYYINVVQGIYRLHSFEQIHHHAFPGDSFKIRLRSIELFLEWVEAHGLLERGLRIRTARQCRLLITRFMLAGNIEGKNQAIKVVNRLLAGMWHPLRLVVLLTPVNSTGFYERVSNWRYRWGKRRARSEARKQAAALHKTSDRS